MELFFPKVSRAARHLFVMVRVGMDYTHQTVYHTTNVVGVELTFKPVNLSGICIKSRMNVIEEVPVV